MKVLLLLLLLLLLLSSSLSLLSPLCRVFTIIYLKLPCLGYTVLQRFCFTVCATCNVMSPVKYVLYLYISTVRRTRMCAVPSIADMVKQSHYRPGQVQTVPAV